MTTAQYTTKQQKGFTLIELLVVISIIAILAVIGVSVFSGSQGAARDGQRRSEASSIAKSIEASKDFEKGVYAYTTADSGKDFPKGFPTDPNYCIYTSTAASLPAAGANPASWGASACPTGFTLASTNMATATTGNLGATTPDVKSWNLCVKLERSTTPFCIKSLTP
jgi:prepilin-type N-terminal cleavage/methylation domain-containing protein